MTGMEEEGETCVGWTFCVHTYIEKYISFVVSYGAYLEAILYCLLEGGIPSKKGSYKKKKKTQKGIRRSKEWKWQSSTG